MQTLMLLMGMSFVAFFSLIGQEEKILEKDIPDIPDPLIREAYERAANQNILAAVNPKVFYGYYSVCADGLGFGYGNSYPSLDGHQMTDPRQEAILWPLLKDDKRFYYNGMPTGIATLPSTYEKWESTYNDVMDLAAMGRVWYVESNARANMHDAQGLTETIRRVCREGQENGYYWRERYNEKGEYSGNGPQRLSVRLRNPVKRKNVKTFVDGRQAKPVFSKSLFKNP